MPQQRPGGACILVRQRHRRDVRVAPAHQTFESGIGLGLALADPDHGSRPQAIGHITKRLPEILQNGQRELPGQFRALLWRLGENFKEMDRQVRELEREIKTWHRENEASRKLEKIPGIGALTASALAASVGNASCFADGRQMVAWLGLVPRQHSTGGKLTLLGISKRRDTYLRMLLIHGDHNPVLAQ